MYIHHTVLLCIIQSQSVILAGDCLPVCPTLNLALDVAGSQWRHFTKQKDTTALAACEQLFAKPLWLPEGDSMPAL